MTDTTTATSSLNPNYLDIDFDTILTHLKERLGESDIFRDYNFEGANITLLLELLAYNQELTTYFLNKIAKNVYPDTIDVYEAMNSIARWIGYNPKGYRSSEATLSITISPSANIRYNDTLSIAAWHQINSTETYEGSTIKFATTSNITETVSTTGASGTGYSYNITVRQGEVNPSLSYTGADLIDNELLLPAYNFAHNDYDDTPYVIQLSVNGTLWDRINDFYDEISGLSDEDNVYMFIYDKYGRSKIQFNSSRNVPGTSDTITIRLLRSLGSNGNVASGTITDPDDNFIRNLRTGSYIPLAYTTVTNAAESSGGTDPETVDEIRENAKAQAHAQFRNVTKVDYVADLEARSDVAIANAWGEQEVAPSGDTSLYNRVYLSVIPLNTGTNANPSWSSSTITTSAGSWTLSATSSASILVPVAYNTTWKNTLYTYLEPKKMLTAYEILKLPTPVYFTFDFGIRIRRLYDFSTVANDVKNKLIYYFRQENQEFNSTINFMDILEYLLDTTIVSPTDSFTNIQGVRNLVMREIYINVTVYEPNTLNNYPQYTTTAYSSTVDNRLRPIEIGYNQFPMLASSILTFTQET